MTGSNGDPTGDACHVGLIQVPTAWLAFGCSLLVHAGGIGALAYFSNLSDPIDLPRLRYARGETPVEVTVRFLSTAELEALTNPRPLQHNQDSGNPTGQALTLGTGSPETASAGIEPEVSEPIKPADIATTIQEQSMEPAPADQPNSQALHEHPPQATPSSTLVDADLVSGSDTAVAPPLDETVQSPRLKPINQKAAASFEPPKTTADGGIENGARVLSLPKPKYPLRSRRRGEEGLVLLEVEVLPNGIAGTIRVLKEPGYPRLIDAAIAAVRAATFDPAMRKGHHIRTVIKVPFQFALR